MTTSPSLLIVDDDERFAETLSLEFRERGWSVDRVGDLDALRALPPFAYTCASVDLRLRAQSGLDAIPIILERSPETRIVVLTGYGSIATAVQAVKLGALDYLTKPVQVEDLLQAFLGKGLATGEEKGADSQTLARREREYVEWVLAACDGNISRAARQLGLHRQSLQRKLRKFTPRS
ncbi:MAG: response regulator [Deltaproteobacteria bacterium]|nr:response regulator [Deltaproteobacteria bacterium]